MTRIGHGISASPLAGTPLGAAEPGSGRRAADHLSGD